MKRKYYFMDVQNVNSYRKSEVIYAQNLTSAKRIASNRAIFPIIYLATKIDANGFVREPLCIKIGGKWKYVEAEHPYFVI